MMGESEKEYEPFIRWQQTLLEERGKIVTLIISLSIASIGFSFSKIINNEFNKCWSKSFVTIGLIALMICLVVGLYVTINRLNGFRQTLKLARAKLNSVSNSELDSMRVKNNLIDRNTILWFNIMIWSFGIAEVLLIVGMMIEYWEKFS